MQCIASGTATMRNTCASEYLLETAVFVEKHKMDFAILKYILKEHERDMLSC